MMSIHQTRTTECLAFINKSSRDTQLHVTHPNTIYTHQRQTHKPVISNHEGFHQHKAPSYEGAITKYSSVPLEVLVSRRWSSDSLRSLLSWELRSRSYRQIYIRKFKFIVTVTAIAQVVSFYLRGRVRGNFLEQAHVSHNLHVITFNNSNCTFHRDYSEWSNIKGSGKFVFLNLFEQH